MAHAGASVAADAAPLGLYVHFPWCVRKCPYCDFNSHSLRGALPSGDYIDALLADLRAQPGHVRARTVGTVFLGGGTPSLFGPADLQRFLDAVRAEWRLATDAEITLEANPGALEHAAFSGYRDAGINRLSLGVQSFDDTQLQKLGRIHSSADACRAVREARAAGFDNINLDLMFGLPGQSPADAAADIAQALELRPTHVSHYHLTLEPNTVFHSRPPAGLPDDDMAWEIQSVCGAQLRAAGFANYEVSAWALPGRQCRHNVNYWRFGDYLGLGAGAHGKLSFDGVITREVRAAHPRDYMQRVIAGTAVTTSVVEPADAVFEFMLNALRLDGGVTPDSFARATGLSPALLQPGLERARNLGLLDDDVRLIRPTARGRLFLDDLQAVFLPDA